MFYRELPGLSFSDKDRISPAQAALIKILETGGVISWFRALSGRLLTRRLKIGQSLSPVYFRSVFNFFFSLFFTMTSIMIPRMMIATV